MHRLYAFSLLFMLSSTGAPVESSLSKNSILVAVIDTGVDVHHPELASWMWQNPGEDGLDAFGRSKKNNGIDDDLNGLVDDHHGWDFCKNRADISDQEGHGTHVTGVIKNSIPLKAKGVDARFMVLKYGGDCQLSKDGFSKAIDYAIQQGAQIINISGGGFSFSRVEMLAFKRAFDAGVTIVSASGNKQPSQQHRSFFPAAYQFSNIYSVAATNASGKALLTTNLNPFKRNLTALGENVLSTLPGNRHGRMTGTSQATAQITGQIIPVVAKQFAARQKSRHFKTRFVSFYSNPNHSWEKQF